MIEIALASYLTAKPAAYLQPGMQQKQ